MYFDASLKGIVIVHGAVHSDTYESGFDWQTCQYATPIGIDRADLYTSTGSYAESIVESEYNSPSLDTPGVDAILNVASVAYDLVQENVG